MIIFINISFAQTKFHVVKLEPKEAPKKVDYKIAKVVDNRVIKDNIGVVQKGLSNKRRLAKFKSDVGTELQKLFNRIYKPTPNAPEFICVIHDLHIDEQTNLYSEKGICNVEIELVKEVASNFYSLGRFNSYIEKGAMDVTKRHGKRIIQALDDCLHQFAQTNWRSESGEEFHFDTEMTCSIAETPMEGLYPSVNRLCKNAPIESFEHDFKKSKKSRYDIDRFELKAKDKENAKKGIMFISDGKDIYMHASRYSYKEYFIKAKHYGRFIYFQDFFSNAKNLSAASPLIGMFSADYRGIILDTQTGKVSILTERYLSKVLKNHPEILDRYNNSKKKLLNRERAILRLNKKLRDSGISQVED
jgi:hypothetical protein